MERVVKLVIIYFGLAVISFFPVVTPVESQNASLPFTLNEIQDICQSGNSTQVPSLNCEYISRCMNYGSSLSKCYTDSKVAPPVIEDENGTLFREDENGVTCLLREPPICDGSNYDGWTELFGRTDTNSTSP